MRLLLVVYRRAFFFLGRRLWVFFMFVLHDGCSIPSQRSFIVFFRFIIWSFWPHWLFVFIRYRALGCIFFSNINLLLSCIILLIIFVFPFLIASSWTIPAWKMFLILLVRSFKQVIDISSLCLLLNWCLWVILMFIIWCKSHAILWYLLVGVIICREVAS